MNNFSFVKQPWIDHAATAQVESLLYGDDLAPISPPAKYVFLSDWTMPAVQDMHPSYKFLKGDVITGAAGSENGIATRVPGISGKGVVIDFIPGRLLTLQK